MSTGIWSAVSGATAQTTLLDIAANNVANASTVGYRADRAVFRQVLSRAQGSAAGTNSMRYSVVQFAEADPRGGAITSTGRALDVALKDPNQWFRISTPQGTRYTRSGAVQVGGDGVLRASDGSAYQDSAGGAIRVRGDARTATISSDGSLVVDGVASGQKLSVANFPDPKVLAKDGAVAMRALPGTPKPELATPDLATGSLESSYSSLLTGLTTLVQASREFEIMARVIDAFSNVEHRTAQEVGRGK